MNRETRQEFFINDYDAIYTVKLAWNINQPFVCGTLEKVVEYALKPNNGIEYFAEISGYKLKKISKKQLKSMLSHGEFLPKLAEQLFKKY